MKNSSFKNINGLHFGTFLTKNNSEETENNSEKTDMHEETELEFFRQLDDENHHFPSS